MALFSGLSVGWTVSSGPMSEAEAHEVGEPCANRPRSGAARVSHVAQVSLPPPPPIIAMPTPDARAPEGATTSRVDPASLVLSVRRDCGLDLNEEDIRCDAGACVVIYRTNQDSALVDCDPLRTFFGGELRMRRRTSLLGDGGLQRTYMVSAAQGPEIATDEGR